MKPADFIVRIPEPCHQDWNQMQPDAKGKFCSSCSKSVFDFSNKTDVEIKTILTEHKDQKVCGHFKKTQIDRPLNITLDLNNIPKNISLTKTFAIALFLVFGSLLFSCKDEKGKEVPVERVLPDIVDCPVNELQPPDLNEMITGEAPMDSTIGTEVVTMVNGGLEYYTVGAVEPPPIQVIDPPDVMTVGSIAYYVLDYQDTTREEPRIDSGLITKNKRSVESLKPDPDKLFSVYPNPSSGEFTIAYDLLKRSDVTIAIYNLNGALARSVTEIKAQYEGRYRLPVNLNDLPNGIYVVSLINGDQKSTERLVIAR